MGNIFLTVVINDTQEPPEHPRARLRCSGSSGKGRREHHLVMPAAGPGLSGPKTPARTGLCRAGYPCAGFGVGDGSGTTLPAAVRSIPHPERDKRSAGKREIRESYPWVDSGWSKPSGSAQALQLFIHPFRQCPPFHISPWHSPSRELIPGLPAAFWQQRMGNSAGCWKSLPWKCRGGRWQQDPALPRKSFGVAGTFPNDPFPSII